MQKKRLFHFYPARSSFIAKDERLLESDFLIIPFDFHTAQKWLTPWMWVKQLVFLLWHVRKGDQMFCQFAGFHSLLPAMYSQLFGIPCLISVGGNDAHFFPALGYGNYTRPILKWFTIQSLLRCTRILPKHRSLIYSDYTYDTKHPSPQGLKARIPQLPVEKCTIIENGYSGERWYCGEGKKTIRFITICTGMQHAFQREMKGLNLLAKTADLMPDVSIHIVGVPEGYRWDEKPGNIKLLPPTSAEALRELLSASAFYLQLSLAEGFPNALCEAMLCECVPIGSAVFSIPEIIGDTGYLLNRPNAEELAELMQKAMTEYKPEKGINARNSIMKHYPETKRKAKLLDALKGI